MSECCEIQHKMKNLLWTNTRTVRVSCAILAPGLFVIGTKAQTLLTNSAVMLSALSCLPPREKFVVIEFSPGFIRSCSYIHKTTKPYLTGNSVLRQSMKKLQSVEVPWVSFFAQLLIYTAVTSTTSMLQLLMV